MSQRGRARSGRVCVQDHTGLYALDYCLPSSWCCISSAEGGAVEVGECASDRVVWVTFSNVELETCLTASMIAGISSLVRNYPPPLSCLGRLLRVGCEPRKEAPLLLPAAAAGVPEEVARCFPRPWLTPRRELLEIVVGLSAIATADCGRRPFPLPRRVFIVLTSIEL